MREWFIVDQGSGLDRHALAEEARAYVGAPR